MARSNYVGMDAERGEVYRTVRRAAGANVAVAVDDYITRVGVQGQDDADRACRTLASELEDLMQDIEDDRLPSSEVAGAFYPRAATLTYSTLSQLPGDILTSPDFWRYLAVFHLYKVIDWIHPNDNGDRWGTNPSQFTRSMPLSLFIRGQISVGLDDADHVVVDGINDVDVWTSHVVAVLYGTAPRLVVEYMRVLSDWQDPKTGAFNALRREQLRELARLLTAARSNVVFDLTDARACREVVEGLVPYAEAGGQRRLDNKSKKSSS